MALVNPSSLYTGGNERFNPNPYLNIVFRARQQKAAKDAALNQYYSELPNKINDKGMRDQDIQGLNEKKDQLQQFYLANSDAIKNPSLDKGASQYQYGKLVRDIQGGVQKSLNEGKTGLELGKMHQSGQNDYIWQDPDIIAKIAAHEKPIWDSDHVPLNMDELMKPPKPLDPKPIQAIMKGFPMQQGEPVISETPGDKYSNTITPTFKFSDDSKNAINNYGTTLYHNNPSLKREIDNASPEQKTQLNDIYKKHFGIDATTPEQLATGYAISLAPTPDTKPKIVPNFKARDDLKVTDANNKMQKQHEWQQTFEGIRQGNRLALANAQNKFKQMNTQEQSDGIDSYIQHEKQVGEKERGLLMNETGNIYVNPAPAVMTALGNPKEVIAQKDGSYKIDNQTISGDQYKAITQKSLFGTKFLSNQLIPNTTGKTVTTKTSSSTSGSSSGHIKIKGTNNSLF